MAQFIFNIYLENYESQIIIQDPYLHHISIFNTHGKPKITLTEIV